MAHITIPAGEPRVSYTPVSSSTGPFNVTFPIFDEADLNVVVDGVLLTSSDWTFTPTDTRTGGYQSGTITLDVATTEEVVIYRDTTRSRTSDYAAGPLDINTLNTDVDRTVARDQDLKMRVDRALRFPLYEAAVDELPAAADRANGLLGFDADGNPTIAGGTSDVSISAAMTPVVQAATLALARTAMDVPSRAQAAYACTFVSAMVADGTTDDTAAVVTWLAAAAAAGVWADGLGKTIGVTSVVYPDNLVGICNVTFKQLAPAASSSVKTLSKTSGSGPVRLRNVKVDKNGSGANGAMTTAGGIWFDGISNIFMDDVEVTGYDKGKGIYVANGSNIYLTRPYVHDLRWTDPSDPGTDLIDGIRFQGCTNINVYAHHIDGLDGKIGASAAAYIYTRGMVFADCTGFRVFGGVARQLNTAYDVSGDGSNQQFAFFGTRAELCTAHGHKVANTGSDGRFVGCVSDKCGYTGFVVSGASAAGLAHCEDITFVGCEAISTGYGGAYSASGVAGFAVWVGAYSTHLPQNIRFTDCIANDEQGSPTMKYGFYNDVVPGVNNTYSNRMIGCQVIGATVADTSGIGDYWFSGSLSSTQSIPNNTNTLLAWTSEQADPYSLHTASSSVITVREAGLYMMMCQLEFAVNSTGQRSLRLVLNGSSTNYREQQPANATAGPTLRVCVIAYLAKDTTVEFDCYQNSGGALNASSGTTRIEVRKLHGAL